MKNFREWMEGVHLERGREWLEEQRKALMGWPLERLVRWLQWNDPLHADEGLSVPEAVELVMRHVEENLETPDEMMRSNARWPDRSPAPNFLQ